MADTVQVYLVAGIDPNGNVTELAKFFSREAADQHKIAYLSATSSKQSLYRELGVIVRTEAKAEQHPAHWGHIGHKS